MKTTKKLISNCARRNFTRSLTTVLGSAAAFGSGALVSTSVRAQSWPGKPITMIAPYPAGGGVDTVARLIGDLLAQRLGQPVTIENKPGAGGTIGATALARAAADGYTLMLGSIVDYAIAPHVIKGLPFELKRDLMPVVEVGYGTVGLIVTADLPVKNLRELIAMAKAKPGELSFASSGIGGLQHLNAEMFKQMAGVNIVHVPYKGTTQFLPDLVSGRIPMSIDSIPAHLPNLRAGKTRALAVASSTRSSAMPEVPTMAEAGLPGYESSTNYTVFVPTKTPADVVARLNQELNIILKSEAIVSKLLGLGIVTRGGTVESAQARIISESDRWANVIKVGNLTFN
jgi:tripartite-type tricarboxylate transporter receptor subunit TctC